jgi:hypothetical protein
MSTIRLIFNLVANWLKYLAFKTGRTYNEINILIYYGCIPFTWLALLDFGFGFHYFKIAFLIFVIGFFIGCRDFSYFSDKLFHASVRFLNYFNRFGSNYYASSVWICAALPLVIYAGLIYWVW